MKTFWQSSLMFNSFILLPGSLAVFIYSVGAAVLLAQVQLFVWALAAFCAAMALQGIFGILSEW